MTSLMFVTKKKEKEKEKKIWKIARIEKEIQELKKSEGKLMSRWQQFGKSQKTEYAVCLYVLVMSHLTMISRADYNCHHQGQYTNSHYSQQPDTQEEPNATFPMSK